MSCQPLYISIVIAISGPIATVLLAWAISSRVTNYWAIKQKRKEIDLSMRREFHSLYGDFFANWKIWNQYFKFGKSGDEFSIRIDQRYFAILEKICESEGKMESILVSIVSTKSLSEDDVIAIGKYRQCYQTLRQNVRDIKMHPWSDSENEEYVAFKILSLYISKIIIDEKVNYSEVSKIKSITSNRNEKNWTDLHFIDRRL